MRDTALTVATPGRSTRLRNQRGFTLAELIVSVMLLTVGMCALAGTAAWLTRETTASRRVERAAILARSRLELLRLHPCTSGTGVQIHGDLVERWTLAASGRQGTAVVTMAGRDSGYMREQRYQGAFAC